MLLAEIEMKIIRPCYEALPDLKKELCPVSTSFLANPLAQGT